MKVSFGNYTPKEIQRNKTTTKVHFVKGWWTDLNDNPITEALIDDIVKFHIETKNIPDGQPIFISLYDDDRRIRLDEDKVNDKINLVNSTTGKSSLFQRVYGNKLVKTINLTNLNSFTENDSDNVLELFFACSYMNDHEDLPHKTSEYLKVKGMPKIIFVNGHWRLAHYTIGEVVPVGPTQQKNHIGLKLWLKIHGTILILNLVIVINLQFIKINEH